MKGPLSSAPPFVAFVIQQGKQLTGAAGSWSGTGAIKYAYQWQRCDTAGAHCTSIRGATGRTYTFVAKDVGRTIGFRVRATDKTGTTRAYASLVGPVAGPRARLVSTGQPTITGVPREGQALQVSAGSWSLTPTTIEYQWLRCNPNGRLCEPLPGATASTYAVTAADTRHALLAVVHATAGAASQAAVSVATPSGRHRPDGGPVEQRASDSDRDEQAGQTTHGLDRTLVGLGRDRLRLSVVPLRRGGRALQVSARRHEADVHPRRQGRRPDPWLRRPRHRRHGHRDGLRQPDRADRGNLGARS